MRGMAERIKKRLHEIGMAEREASRRAGFGLSYVGDVIHGRSKEPSAERLARLARVLDCDLDYLLGRSSAVRPVREEKSFSPNMQVSEQPIRMLNLYAAPSTAQALWGPISTEAVDKVPVIPPLVHVKDAYAYSISNAYMEPRYFIGEVVYLHPGIMARVGDFVLAKKKDGRAGVARLTAIDEASYTLGYLNGGEPQRVERGDLEFIHRIVGSAG